MAARVLELTAARAPTSSTTRWGSRITRRGPSRSASSGRQIFIASSFKPVEFDIFAFYRGRHTYVGIDTLALSSVETADLLRELVPGFASGDLRPFPILPDAVYRLEDAAEAYRTVLGSSRDRVILRPAKEG